MPEGLHLAMHAGGRQPGCGWSGSQWQRCFRGFGFGVLVGTPPLVSSPASLGVVRERKGPVRSGSGSGRLQVAWRPSPHLREPALRLHSASSERRREG